MEEILSQIHNWIRERECDAQIPHFSFDGTYTRFGKNRKRFFFVGHSNVHNGKPFFVGFIMDWYSGDKKTFNSLKKSDYKSDPTLKKKVFSVIKQTKVDEQKSYTDFIENLKPAKDTHPYLISKVIFPNGAKALDKALVIPATSIETNEIIGYQLIFEKPLCEMDQEYINIGEKKIKTLAKTNKYNVGSLSKTYFQIGDIKDTLVFAEGFATTSAIFEMTNYTCFCVFGHHSIFDVAYYFSLKHPEKKIIIALDMDAKSFIEKQNDKGEVIKEKSFLQKIRDKINKCSSLNIHTLVPPFQIAGETGTDFNDFYIYDRNACKTFVQNFVNDIEIVMICGNSGGQIWINSSKRGIKSLTSKVNKEELLLHVANNDYWNKVSGTNGNPNFKLISTRIQSIAGENEFDISNIKRTGVSLNEKGDLVFNVGDRVIGERHKNHIYSIYDNNPLTYPVPKEEDLNMQDILEFKENLSLLNFKDKNMHITLLSWIILAPFFDCLKFVPHMVLSGSHGSGKSWTIKNILKKFLKPFNPQSINVSSSYAGFVREVHSKPSIYIFDEKEFTQNSDTDDLLSSFRIASTKNKDFIVKAIPNSDSVIKYNCNFIGCISAIVPPVFNNEDAARFLEVTFTSENPNKKNFDAVLTITKTNLEKISLNVFNHCIIKWHKISEDILSIFQKISLERQVGGHNASKLATILSFAKNTFLVNPQDYINYENDLIGATKKEEDEAPHALVLNRIFHSSLKSENKTIFEILTNNDPHYNQELAKVELAKKGILYKHPFIYVATASSLINGEIFKSYEALYSSWKRTLASKFEKAKIRFGYGVQAKLNPKSAIKISIEELY